MVQKKISKRHIEFLVPMSGIQLINVVIFNKAGRKKCSLRVQEVDIHARGFAQDL